MLDEILKGASFLGDKRLYDKNTGPSLAASGGEL